MAEGNGEIVIQVKPENAIYPHHPDIRHIIRRVNVRDVALEGLTDRTKRYLAETVMSVFPERNPPKDLTTQEPPHYRAAILTPKLNGEDQPTPKNLAIVMLAGISNTGPSQAHMAAEVYASAETSMGKNAVGLVASMGSFVSIDTVGDRYVSDIVTRATYQAVYIMDMLRKHPVEELVLAGRSMGGTEAAYVYSILKKLLEDNHIDTKISGLLVVQAGGQFRQSRGEFLKKIGNMPRGAAAEAFPSLIDIYNTQIALDEAKEAFDAGRVVRLQAQLKEMQRRYLYPPIADQAVLDRVNEIDVKIAKAWGNNGKKVRRLSEERFRLVNSVLSNTVKGADVRQLKSPRGMREIMKAKLPWAVVGMRVLRAIFVDNTKNVMEPLPHWVRDKIDCPVAVVWGNEDAVFDSRLALSRMTGERLNENKSRRKEYIDEVLNEKRKKTTPDGPVKNYTEADLTDAERDAVYHRGDYFGKSKIRFTATVGNWGHASLLINPHKYADIFTDIINRMRIATKQRGDNDPPTKIDLKY